MEPEVLAAQRHGRLVFPIFLHGFHGSISQTVGHVDPAIRPHCRIVRAKLWVLLFETGKPCFDNVGFEVTVRAAHPLDFAGECHDDTEVGFAFRANTGSVVRLHARGEQ